MNIRRSLYAMARLLGDISAVRRGRIVPRITNKVIGRSIVRRLWWR